MDKEKAQQFIYYRMRRDLLIDARNIALNYVCPVQRFTILPQHTHYISPTVSKIIPQTMKEIGAEQLYDDISKKFRDCVLELPMSNINISQCLIPHCITLAPTKAHQDLCRKLPETALDTPFL